MKTVHGALLEISASDACDLACPAKPLIDIRTDGERQAGMPVGAIPMTAEALLELAKNDGADNDVQRYVICAEGVRSLELVKRLHRLGHSACRSVAGGFLAWQAGGLPVDHETGLDSSQLQRYARHLVMPQIAAAGQEKLLRARVLLVGLGGLNSPSALYLAAAGIGTIGLLDDDRVERSNLQRQVIHGESGIGQRKADSAAARIADLNPDVRTEIMTARLDSANSESLVQGWDVVVDGTDNFPARYALNDACVRLSRPLVYGAVMRFQGQVSVFWPGAPSAAARRLPCFRCLLPVPPPAADAPGCSEAGVLGVLPGIVGTLQAIETIKILLGLGTPLLGKLQMIDALSMTFHQARIAARSDCQSCGTVKS
jgi:molybdopterin/thiamine biosynthesis adenylyltransferase/rhodanese-related sulfurtransferase